MCVVGTGMRSVYPDTPMVATLRCAAPIVAIGHGPVTIIPVRSGNPRRHPVITGSLSRPCRALLARG